MDRHKFFDTRNIIIFRSVFGMTLARDPLSIKPVKILWVTSSEEEWTRGPSCGIRMSLGWRQCRAAFGGHATGSAVAAAAAVVEEQGKAVWVGRERDQLLPEKQAQTAGRAVHGRRIPLENSHIRTATRRKMPGVATLRCGDPPRPRGSDDLGFGAAAAIIFTVLPCAAPCSLDPREGGRPPPPHLECAGAPQSCS